MARASAGRRRICFPFTGESIGGSHISTLLLIQNLNPARFEPVIVLHREGTLAAHLRELALPYRELPIEGPLHGGPNAIELARRLALSLRPIIGLLRAQRIDAVHANDLRCNQTWAAPSSLAGIPLVWHQRTKLAPSRLTQWTMSLARRIVCNSQFCRSSLPARFRSRADVVLNPFDTTSAPPDKTACRRRILEAAGRTDAAHVIGFCGTLSRQKRPEQFLHTAAEIRRRLAGPALFVLVGHDRDGRLGELHDLASRLGLAGDVYFAGFRHPVEDWLAGLDVLLAPQVGEAFGRTLVEAMLLGVNVVATDAGGHSDLVQNGRTGLLTPPDDPAAAADACLRLLLEPEWARDLRDAARRFARASFGVEDHARAMAEIYDRVLASKR